MNQDTKNLALLIDSENVSSKYLDGIFDELSQYGTITYRRIYGDFTKQANARWSGRLLEKSIIPIQQFSNTSGKNSSDSALIIDAMDLLYNSNVDGFCIVSSDSDFTRLAARLRESGKTVIGMGEKKTPDSFRAACTVFTELENLLQPEGDAVSSPTDKAKIEEDIINIITKNDNNGKQTGPGEIGSRLQSKYPDFDIRTFGYSQLSRFLEDMPGIEVHKDRSSITVSLKSKDDLVVEQIVSMVRSAGPKGLSLSALGQQLRQTFPDFNVKIYGYSQLYKFIDSIPELSVKGNAFNRKVVCRK